MRESPDGQRLTRKPTLTGCSNKDGAGTLRGGGAGSWPFRGRVMPGGKTGGVMRSGDVARQPSPVFQHCGEGSRARPPRRRGKRLNTRHRPIFTQAACRKDARATISKCDLETHSRKSGECEGLLPHARRKPHSGLAGRREGPYTVPRGNRLIQADS